MFLLSILYHIFGIVLCAFFLFWAFLAWIVTLPFDKGRRLVHLVNGCVTYVFFAIPPFWRTRMEGLENIDRSKSYVIVMNHTEGMDIPVMYRIPLYFKWVSKREVFFMPIFGQFLALRGDIAISRGNGKEAMAQVIEKGKKILSWGQSVAIFPEGTRSKGGVVGRFKSGAFNLASEAGVDILPIAIEGTDRVFSMKTGRYSWRNTITIRVLPAVSSSWSDGAECKELIDGVRTSIVDALDSIKERNAQEELERLKK